MAIPCFVFGLWRELLRLPVPVFKFKKVYVQNSKGLQVQPAMSAVTANTLKEISMDDLKTMHAIMGLSTGMSDLNFHCSWFKS